MIIFFLGILIFLFINFELFDKNRKLFKESVEACMEYSEGQSCEVFLGKKALQGVCQYNHRDHLVCKPMRRKKLPKDFD